jgi:hypothetical protein
MIEKKEGAEKADIAEQAHGVRAGIKGRRPGEAEEEE